MDCLGSSSSSSSSTKVTICLSSWESVDEGEGVEESLEISQSSWAAGGSGSAGSGLEEGQILI